MNAITSVSQGNIISGYAVTPHKFQGVTTLDQIENYGLVQPSVAQSVRKDSPKSERAAGELRKHIQRTFDKARRTRAELYSGYIENVEVNGHLGGTPAITLYTAAPINEVSGGLCLPYGSALVAIDGETQTEARFVLRERKLETGANRIAVTIYHSMPYDAAMQILHDYNAYAKPIGEKQLANFNRQGPLTVAASEVIKEAGLAPEMVNLRGAKPTKKTAIANAQVLMAIAGYQLNGGALKSTVSPGHLKELNRYDGPAVPAHAVQAIAAVVKQAVSDNVVAMAPQQLWQVAGALLASNVSPLSLNWRAAVQAYADTATQTRGGPRLSVSERLAKIHMAFGG